MLHQLLKSEKKTLYELWQIAKKIIAVDDLIYNLCNYFLGSPYKLLSEPTKMEHISSLPALLKSLAYDNEFSFSLSSFDCVTFVETIIALALSRIANNSNQFNDLFLTNLCSLRYRKGISTFLRRNYFFTCVDWIPNNDWILFDITNHISQNHLIAKTYINRLGMLYHYKKLDSIRNNISIDDLNNTLIEIGYRVIGQCSCLPYISLHEFLQNYNNFIELFPQVSVICIVRPDWDVTDIYPNYGTHLNISHLGICLKRSNELEFFHASSINDKIVVTTKLTDYLSKYLDHPTIKGINVLQIKF